MAYPLICNYPSCSNRMEDHAWISSCSHMFCDEHGSLEFASHRSTKCPLCETDLSNHMDIVKTDINPQEQYKSMILAGQRPETVIETAARALAFWNYQTQLQSTRDKQERADEERKFQETVARLIQEKSNMEVELKNAIREADEQKRRGSDLDNALAEKTRQNQKLTAALDAMRCRLAEQDARQQQKSSVVNYPAAANIAPRPGFQNTRLGGRMLNNNMQQAPLPQRGTATASQHYGNFNLPGVSFGEGALLNNRPFNRQTASNNQNSGATNSVPNSVPSFHLNF